MNVALTMTTEAGQQFLKTLIYAAARIPEPKNRADTTTTDHNDWLLWGANRLRAALDCQADNTSPASDLSEDFHSAARCGQAGPPCPGCQIDLLNAQLTAVNEQLAHVSAALDFASAQRDQLRTLTPIADAAHALRDARAHLTESSLVMHPDLCNAIAAVIAAVDSLADPAATR